MYCTSNYDHGLCRASFGMSPWNALMYSAVPSSYYRCTVHLDYVKIPLFFIAQRVSNIHLVTKDFEIVPLTNLLKLFLVGRVAGGGQSVLLGLY